ncbi:MAG: hypothetical protein II919_03360 [Lachnospiraceae bacterium]|nr:hypothetical protein [Lachnospiraceae bacterium]
MELLGFENCICFDEGDEYGNKVINTDTNEVIGSFCTDSSYLVIMYFEDLMNYNPNFSDHIEWPDSNTIIKNFDGELEVVADRQKGEFYIIGRTENGKTKRVYSSKYALSSIIYCGKCGDLFRRVAWKARGAS